MAADLITRVRGLVLDPYKRFLNVHWASGKFTFVSGASPKLNEYWGVSAFSALGQTWTNINSHIEIPKSGNSSTALTSSIRGEARSEGGFLVDAILAGGIAAYATRDSVGNAITRVVSVAAISRDGGSTWTDTSLPFVAPDTWSRPEMYPGSRVHGVGYNTQQQSFYAAADKAEQGNVRVVVFRRGGSGGWSEAGASYPKDTVICDLREGLVGKLKFASSQRPDQVTQSGISLSTDYDGIVIGGKKVTVPAVQETASVAARGSTIMVGGFDAGGNSVQARSFDNGKTWSPIPELTSIYGAGQGGGFVPVFSCS